MAERSENPQDAPSRFTEPSEEVQRRNRITGFIFLCFILGLIALAMIARVYGS
jgi:hypothetical protein